MSADAHRRGWCPGALRPMPAGDGLILRLRIVGGALGPDLARALAQGAEDYGNGLIDLSARANLQLRGATADRLPALQAWLDGLGLLDAHPDAEAMRNILASSLAGLDAAALLDIGPQIQALDARLREDKALHRLPAKFLFLIDDGGRLPLPAGMADIAFLATPGEAGPSFAVHLAGTLVGSCTVEQMSETAARLGHVFLQLRGESDRRMSGLVRRIGAQTIARAAGLAAAPFADMQETPGAAQRRAPRRLGVHLLGAHVALGFGVRFGRLDARALRIVADEAEAAGGEIRLSPWRAMFIVGKRIDPQLAARMADAGFILDEDAPIRAVAACSGQPACLQGATASQADGMRLAPLARGLAASDIALHVSACAKGCAHPQPAPVTLVGRAGAYDLVLDGCAGDEPLLRGLDLPGLEILLQRLADSAPAERGAQARQFSLEMQR